MSKASLKSLVCLVMVLTLPGVQVWSQSIDPAEYLETSLAAVSLPRVISMYNDYIDEQDPVLYGIFDVDFNTRSSTIPSTEGNLSGTFMGIDGFFYARLFQTGDVSFRALFLPSFFTFNMDTATKQDYPVFGDETFLNWLSGYALFGVQARRGWDRLTLGGVLLVEPMIDDGSNLFAYESDSEGVITEETSFDRVYADFSLNGWNLDTMISAEYIEQLAAEKLFDLAATGMKAGPVFQYLGRAGSFRPGAGIAWEPLPGIDVDAGAKLGIDSESIGLGEAHLDAGFTLPLIRDVRQSGKDMSFRLTARGSLCEFNDSIIPGGKVELSLYNYPFFTYLDIFGLNYLGNLTIGIAWNHADTLLRMPFEDQWIIYFRGGGGYYGGSKKTR